MNGRDLFDVIDATIPTLGLASITFPAAGIVELTYLGDYFSLEPEVDVVSVHVAEGTVRFRLARQLTGSEPASLASPDPAASRRTPSDGVPGDERHDPAPVNSEDESHPALVGVHRLVDPSDIGGADAVVDLAADPQIERPGLTHAASPSVDHRDATRDEAAAQGSAA